MEIRLSVGTLYAIVESGIEEYGSRKEFVNLKVEGIFPFHLCFAVISEEIDATFPSDVLEHLPTIVGGDVGPVVERGVLSFF